MFTHVPARELKRNEKQNKGKHNHDIEMYDIKWLWTQTMQIHGIVIKLTSHHTSFYSLNNTKKKKIERPEISER